MTKPICALTFLALLTLGCDEPAEGITVPLSGTDSSGRVYVLDSARFQVTGPVNTLLEAESVAGDSLGASLPPGGYSVELLPGWQLIRLPEGTPMMATLVSANPQMATVMTGSSANVVFVFDVMGEIVAMTGDGDIDIGFEVNEPDGGLADGGGDGGGMTGPCAALPMGTVCRPSAGPCDTEEVCDGVSADCPADDLAAAGTSCGAGLECDAMAMCVDVDECLTDNGGCDPLVTCTNTVGGRTCGACPMGTVGDGTVCSVEVVDLAGGQSTSCAVLGDGRLFCWGQNNYGQLGQGDTTARDGAVQVGTDTDWSSVAAGRFHACGIRAGGQLYCWGGDWTGQTGDGTAGGNTLTPAQVGMATDWLRVFAEENADTTCGIRAGGALYCWGRNTYGQLGQASPSVSPTPLAVPGGTGWTDVGLSDYHTCGIQAGALFCWGRNLYRQLGVGTSTATFTSPQRVGTDSDWVQVEASRTHTCGRRGGQLFCWGYNGQGQLGTASGSYEPTPAQVGSASDWADIGLGSQSTCGLRSGQLFCWGDNYRGALGDGSGLDSDVPVAVGAATDWDEVVVSQYRACALATDGRAECWGDNQYDLLLGSDVAPTEIVTAQEVAPTGGWSTVRGGQSHTLGIRDGELWAWGSNNGSALGRAGGDSGVPVRIGTASDWTAVDAGVALSCGIRGGGELYCWGQSYTGIGSGTIYTPTRVGSMDGWSAISLAHTHVCAIRAGELWCWGRNDRGQVGDGSFTDATVPVRIGTDTDWTTVTTGYRHTCGVRGSGSLYCWGDNAYGQVGDGTTGTDRASPQRVGMASDWTSVALTNTASCGVQGDRLYCWGSNASSQLGNPAAGSTEASPFLVDPSPGWAMVDGPNAYHNCATRGGILYCWGRTQYGLMADGNAGYRTVSSPAFVTGATAVTDAARGAYTNHWITGGSLFGAGQNQVGQIGVGIPWRQTPAPLRLP